MEEININNVTFDISQWIRARNIHKGSTSKQQFVKLIEEAGELAADLSRGRDIKDSIGDMYVVMCAICEIEDINIAECMQLAYNEIKDRKGRMVDGVFVKEE